MQIVQDFGIGADFSTPSINHTPVSQERVLFFLDYANIDRAASNHSFQLDFGNLLQYVSECLNSIFFLHYVKSFFKLFYTYFLLDKMFPIHDTYYKDSPLDCI